MDPALEPGLHWQGDDLVLQPKPTTDLRRIGSIAYAVLLVVLLSMLVIQNDWTTLTVVCAATLAVSLMLLGLIAWLRSRDPVWAGRDRNAPVVISATLLAEVRELNQASRRLEGVKLVRKETGLDLADAAQVARAAGPTDLRGSQPSGQAERLLFARGAIRRRHGF